ncbi:MAG TPA: NAD(P)/FAD-dependent oxidoreductase [Bacteroidales bacterium]|nr:NAD(P)/FAD-dependent oxidoreductase [Bacteroidales bacterium]
MNASILNISVFILLIISIAGSVFVYLLRKGKSNPVEDIYWISRDNGTSMRLPSPPSIKIPFHDYESNVPGIFLTGELAGSQTMNDAINFGNEAVEQISRSLVSQNKADYDLVIVGAGPAGISAAIAAKGKEMRFILLEQDTLAGAIISHCEESISLSEPLNIPLEGEVILRKGSKDVLISLWHQLILKYHIPLQEYSKVESVINLNGYFTVISSDGQNFTTSNVLLATGLWTNRNKLNIPGEDKLKVGRRLIQPEKISGKNILIIGGNDKAIEAAIQLSEKNKVILSCKNEKLDNIKSLDNKLIGELLRSDQLEILLNTNPVIIEDDYVILYSSDGNLNLRNDLVYIFNDIQSTRNFLERCGVKITNIHHKEAV